VRAKSNSSFHESLFFTTVLVLLGLFSIYGGAHWLRLLIPAAVIVWLAAGIRRRMTDEGIDGRAQNRNYGR
jgi:hypothetical protein